MIRELIRFIFHMKGNMVKDQHRYIIYLKQIEVSLKVKVSKPNS